MPETAWGTTDDERMAAAEAIIDGRPTPDTVQEPGERGCFSRRNLLVLVLLLGGLAVIVLAGLWAARSNHGHAGGAVSTSIPQWREILGLVVTVSGFVLFGWGAAQWLRRGQLRTQWMRAASALTPELRKQLQRQATGRAPLDPAHLALVRYVARQVRARRSSAIVYGGIVLMQAGTAISARSVGRAVSVSVIFLSMVVLGTVAFRDSRRAERFLAEHSAEGNS